MIPGIEMDAETLRSFSRMVYGHEIWIEGVERNGNEVSAFGLYGHKLLPDKPMPTDYANVLLYDDDHRVEDPEREIVNEPHGWKFTFEDKGADVYTLYVDSNSVWVTNDEGWHRGGKRDYDAVNYAGAFNMVAKRIISKDGKNPGNVMHASLEIMPSESTLKVGKETELKVLYEGNPLPNQKVIVYCRGWDELKTMKTDANGILRLVPEDKGTYAFIAKYTDTDKATEEFDETVFTMALTIEAE